MAELRWQKYDGYFHDAIVKQRTALLCAMQEALTIDDQQANTC
jgi:hypothetical protein